MADITWNDVVALQSNLSTVSAETQTIILAYVNESLSPDAFGGESSSKYRLARIYLAAHMGELARTSGSGAAGQVSSETIGTSSISISYASLSASGDALMLTRWGAMYAEMLATSPLRMGITSGPS